MKNAVVSIQVLDLSHNPFAAGCLFNRLSSFDNHVSQALHALTTAGYDGAEDDEYNTSDSDDSAMSDDDVAASSMADQPNLQPSLVQEPGEVASDGQQAGIDPDVQLCNPAQPEAIAKEDQKMPIRISAGEQSMSDVHMLHTNQPATYASGSLITTSSGAAHQASSSTESFPSAGMPGPVLPVLPSLTLGGFGAWQHGRSPSSLPSGSWNPQSMGWYSLGLKSLSHSPEYASPPKSTTEPGPQQPIAATSSADPSDKAASNSAAGHSGCFSGDSRSPMVHTADLSGHSTSNKNAQAAPEPGPSASTTSHAAPCAYGDCPVTPSRPAHQASSMQQANLSLTMADGAPSLYNNDSDDGGPPGLLSPSSGEATPTHSWNPSGLYSLLSSGPVWSQNYFTMQPPVHVSSTQQSSQQPTGQQAQSTSSAPLICDFAGLVSNGVTTAIKLNIKLHLH